MIAFLYEHSDFVAPVLGVLLGQILIALFTIKMSSHPQNRWTPMVSQIAVPARVAIISIIVVLIVLLLICVGGILEHQRARSVVGIIIGTLVTALMYWGLMVLLTRLTSPKKRV